MPWHDRSPWRARRDAEQLKTVQQVRRLIETYEAGGLSYAKWLAMVDEVINGDTARVVRVGNQHKPEVQS